MTTKHAPTAADPLEALNERAQRASLRGAWQREEREKEPEIQPWLWRWEDISSCLLEAGRLVPIGDTMRMRTMTLVNPSRPSPYGTTRTITMTIQHLGPGEMTESHRHTRTSLYFMVQGSGSIHTIAEGEQQSMEPGDLLIQPSWTWHGTSNNGDDQAIWITVQDTGIINTFDAEFREQYPEGPVQPVTKPDGYHFRRLGILRPRTQEATEGQLPIKYRWADALEALEELAQRGESNPYDGVVIEYTGPATGGPTTPTIACKVQLLRAGEETRPHRHTSNTIYHVVQGQGVTKVGKRKGEEKEMPWRRRDCFFVPPWQWHLHRNTSSSEPAILFSVSDRPLLDVAGLYRQEPT